MLQVQHGELVAVEFMANIASFTKSIVLDNKKPNPKFDKLFPKAYKAADPLGKCPRCGTNVSEGTKGFFCENPNCGFKMWKESKFWTAKKKPLSASIVTALLKDGRVALKGLFSEKTGKKYDATVILDDMNGEFVNFKLDFEK